jgi:hypothetical protein
MIIPQRGLKTFDGEVINRNASIGQCVTIRMGVHRLSTRTKSLFRAAPQNQVSNASPAKASTRAEATNISMLTAATTS